MNRFEMLKLPDNVPRVYAQEQVSLGFSTEDLTMDINTFNDITPAARRLAESMDRAVVEATGGYIPYNPDDGIPIMVPRATPTSLVRAGLNMLRGNMLRSYDPAVVRPEWVARVVR